MSEEKKYDLSEASAADIAKAASEVLDEKLGKNIKLLSVRAKTVVADYFVICTANSSTHVKSLVDEVEYVLEEAGAPVLHRDGASGGDWSVLDFGNVIVHVFTSQAREYYKLEKLWENALEEEGLI